MFLSCTLLFFLLANLFQLNEKFPGDLSATFPFWAIRPTDSKLAKHENLVAKYVSFLNSLSASSALNEFLDTEKHVRFIEIHFVLALNDQRCLSKVTSKFSLHYF